MRASEITAPRRRLDELLGGLSKYAGMRTQIQNMRSKLPRPDAGQQRNVDQTRSAVPNVAQSAGENVAPMDTANSEVMGGAGFAGPLV